MASIQKQFKWRQWLHTVIHPPTYFLASLVVSLGGFLNGLDTGTIGPITTMTSFEDTFGVLSAIIHGLTISTMLLTGTISSLFAGSLSDNLGRTRAVGLGAVVITFGTALEAGSMNLGMLIAGRAVCGIGQGLFLSTLVVYVCEIAPPNRRGTVASMVQFFITIGLCTGYFICYGTNHIPSSLSWRLPFAFQAGVSIFLAFASFIYLPESPRWLAYKGRKNEASVIWDQLGVSNAEREKEILQNTATAAEATMALPPIAAVEVAKVGRLQRIRRDLLSSAEIFGEGTRKQLFLGVFLMSMQQLSGIDGVLYYAPILFQSAGLSSASAAFLASGVSAILILVSTIPAFLLMDRWGRRSSTIYGGIALFTCMIFMGCLYSTDSVHATSGAGRWVVIITIYIFAITYSMTWALGVKIFASEIQPISTRAIATSIAQAANFITNFFVALITPVLLAKSNSAVYFLFGGCAILTVTVCIFMMPETKGRDLDGIVFGEEELRATKALRKLGSWIGKRMGGPESKRNGKGKKPRVEIEMQAVGAET